MDRQYLSVAVTATNTAYLVGFRGRRTSLTICGTFAGVVSGTIWQTGMLNLVEKFAAAEKCGP